MLPCVMRSVRFDADCFQALQSSPRKHSVTEGVNYGVRCQATALHN